MSRQSGQTILDADMATVGVWVRTGVRWWLDELATLVPAQWRRVLVGRRHQVLVWDSASGELERAANSDGRPLALSRAVVVLPRALCLSRDITVPAMNARDLNRMVALDVDRLMPMGGGTMIVAARILSRGNSSDQMRAKMRVRVAGVPRDEAERLCLALTEVGLAVGGVPAAVLAGSRRVAEDDILEDDALAEDARAADVPDGDASHAPVDLLPALRAAGLVASDGGKVVRWWLGALFLFALNIGMLVWRDASANAQLSDIVDQQQGAVNAAHIMATKARRAETAASGVLAARATREPLTLLARIDSALPKGAWLQRFSWTGNTLRMTGFRAAHTDVSGALRQAGFVVLRYNDADASGQTPLGQPFEITLKLGGR